jgi:ABC-2 type transport system permease protein
MSSFTGTAALTRFALRRDRVLLPVWVLVIVASAVSSAQATVDLYPTEASRVQASEAVNGVPALLAFYGRIWDPSSLGELSMMKMSAMGAALLGVFGVMLVIRHTRREEENGRLELIGSTVVGRFAALTAALVVAAVAMSAIAILTALGLTAVGLPSAGSWAFGLAWASTGLSFAAIAAVTAQVTVSARAAVGWGIAAIGIAYLLRALGDSSGDATSSGFLSWLSPLGWGQQVRGFAENRWWVLLIPLAFFVAASTLAYVLAARRDLGSGLIPDRSGPAQASALLSTPIGLAWRMHRATLLAWAMGLGFLGAFLGSISADVGPFLTSDQAREFIAKLGGTSVMTDAFLAVEFSFLAWAVAAYGISVALRLHAEEEDGHAEQVLATAVSRAAWAFSHLIIAVVGTTVLCVVVGLATGLSAGLKSGSLAGLGGTLGAMLVYLPAVWVLTGVAVLLFGLLPRLTVLAWVALVFFLLVAEFGRLLNLPDWLIEVSPFAHVPQLPAVAMSWVQVMVLTLVAGVLVALGVGSFRRRDLVCA